ncbi:MAG: CDP-alcohol phosphatidyltransferase family protein [Dehalococcoidales bacterium]|nr:CDP-alcohol phosphatidyltransferase family protein [Dehalococcoidales bacterium]
MSTFQELRRKAARVLTDPLVPIVSKLKLTPNMMTVIGLILNLVAAVVVGFGHLLVGGVIFLLAAVFDMLDGALARYMGKVTRFGALFDSVVDRITEGALFLSFIFITNPSIWPNNVTSQLVLIFLAMIGSFLTSYIRARAEGLNIDCTVGLFTRVERVIIIALGLLLNQVFIALAIVVVLSFVTVCQRFLHVWRQASK